LYFLFYCAIVDQKEGDGVTTGEKIRSVRKERGLTQKALGDLLNVTQATVGQYETNSNPPKIETLQRIADALGVPVAYLIGSPMREDVCWDIELDQKLSHVGCSVGAYEEDAYLWINYPDGTLEVTEDELKELNDSANSFVRFKLEELKEKHRAQFREKK
jgi:transcriptional regulator with XRE-family HTH domain